MVSANYVGLCLEADEKEPKSLMITISNEIHYTPYSTVCVWNI